MSSARLIKPEFFRSESVGLLPIPTRLMLIGLWTEADCEGRGIASARVLKGALWSLDDHVTADDVEKHLDYLHETGHIILYFVGDKRYFAIVSWDVHQSSGFRRGTSKLPGPDAARTVCTHLHADECTCVLKVKESKVKESKVSVHAHARASNEGQSGKGRATTTPEKFDITPSLKDWATKHGFDKKLRLDRETANFLDYHAAKGSKFLDWRRAWQKWIRTAAQYADERGDKRQSGTPSPVAQGAGRLSLADYEHEMGEHVELPGET